MVSSAQDELPSIGLSVRKQKLNPRSRTLQLAGSNNDE